MANAFPVRTEAELRAGLPHVAYEHVTFLRALQRVPPDPANVARADLEVALLHARNLIDFFWPQTNRRRPHPDGIYALHYVAPWPGNRQLPQRPNELYDALSAQLAHVSVLRTRADTIRNLEQEIHGLGQDLDRHWTEWQRALTGSQWLPLLNEAEADWNARIQ